jgi:preprotein translocase subunit SecB
MEQKFTINKLYLKNLNYTSKQTPDIFFKDEKISEKVNVHINHTLISENRYEVVLNLLAKNKINGIEEDNDFLYAFHIQYAGIFEVVDFEGDELEKLLIIHCGSLLFPFAREKLMGIIAESGFKPLLIQPINFSNVYESMQASK